MNPVKALPFAKKAYAAKIPRGKVIGKRWKILCKLGEGGFGAVYKVEDMRTNRYAALKAEGNRERGCILRLEAMILRRLTGKPHVPQLLQSGKKETYSYIVMTLLGESLDSILRKVGRICTISTQVRIGINVLFGIKQIHDVGFIHRDLKPSNIALGHKYSDRNRFFHIFDFGLSREYIIVDADGKTKMRRPRPYVHFRGTVRYCSVNVQERGEQGRMDDLWCLLYIMVELRGPLPWARVRDKQRILKMKRDTELDELLENCPIEMIPFAEHISTLNYYLRPDYALLYRLLEQVMNTGGVRFTDPYDWESDATNSIAITQSSIMQSEEKRTSPPNSAEVLPPSKKQITFVTDSDPYNPFPSEFFTYDPLGF